LAIEVYIDILISAVVNVQDLKWETSSDYLASTLSFISIAVAVFLVLWTPVFLWIKYEELIKGIRG